MNNGKEKVKIGSEVVRASGHAFNELAETSVKSSEQLQGITNTMRNMSSRTAAIVSLTHNVEDSSQRVTESSMSVVAATQEQAVATSQISDESNGLTQIAREMFESTQLFTI